MRQHNAENQEPRIWRRKEGCLDRTNPDRDSRTRCNSKNLQDQPIRIDRTNSERTDSPIRTQATFGGIIAQLITQAQNRLEHCEREALEIKEYLRSLESLLIELAEEESE